MQTKKYSFYESCVQTCIGFVIAILAQLIIYPFMGIPVTFSQNLQLTCIFTVVSIARGYIVRRFFNKYKL